jgi:ribosomal protein L37AE/L43A
VTLFDGEKEEQQARGDYAHIRYLDMACPHCGRQRVEQCANGKVICEKCHWEPAVNDYNYVHLDLYK